ncbi:hypothetical protein [Methanolobus halotolerans]|uniref:Uncharacterized protein n=1 Tax=Methanolobus halotolerans TaxID=2052935 RepID=A0A4E0Q7K2_9EURY|nr:hypothetical protein [Methanolobus halotolerans]TGC07022.1 hypothetical protein CUN85_12060 [Methanolobus halotolerans]
MKQKISVSAKILLALLNSSATTRTLTEKLGYKKEKEILYKNISKNLKRLEAKEYIRGEEIKLSSPGRRPTKYSIIYNIPILEKMLDEYPSLLPVMQINDNALHLLIEKHRSLLTSTKENHAYPEYYLEEEFKTQLKKSSTFFNLCLRTKTEDLIERVTYLLSISPDVKQEKQRVTEKGVIAFGSSLPVNDFIFDILYKSCLTMDFLNGTVKIQNLRQVTSFGEKIIYNQLIKVEK